MTVIAQQILTENTKDSSNNPHLLSSNVNDVWTDSNYIYVATDEGVSVLDKSNRDRVGYHQTSNRVTSVWASSNYLYYTTWGSGLYRVSISNISGDFSASATQFLHTGSTPSLPTDYLYKVRGHSDSAILIGHSKGVSFYNGSSVYDGYHLLADDFVDNNIGDDPAGWTVDESGGTVEVVQDPFDSDEKCVKLSRSSGTTLIEKTFTAKEKIVAACFVTAASTNVNFWFLNLRNSTSAPAAVGFASTGKFKFWNGSSSVEINMQYEAWRKYHVVAIYDGLAQTLDVYIDGVLFVDSAAVGSGSVDRLRCNVDSNDTTAYIHSVYITDATSETFWGGPSKAVAITSSEIYYSTGSGVARKDSYPTADWEGAVDFHYDEDSAPGLITDLPGKFEVTSLDVAEDKSSQDNTHNKLVVGQRNGVTVIDEHSTPGSGVSTHYGRSDLTTNRQDKLAGYSDVVGAVAIDSDGSYLFVGTREDEDPSDNFEGTKIDDQKWSKTEANGGSVTQDNKITITTTTDMNSNGYLDGEGKWLIVGDFDIQIEFENASNGSDTSYQVICRLDCIAYEAGRRQEFMIELRRGTAEGRVYYAQWRDKSGSWYAAYASTSDTSGKFRLVRTGSTPKFYYWADGWQELSPDVSGFDITEPVFVRILTHSVSSGTALTCDYNNFKINKGTIIWLNGKPKGAVTKIQLSDNSVVEFIEGQNVKALAPA